ncbi:hypothetical protein ACFW6K_07200 [Streptomyces sp. NPDC058733]|uniref:hypothetical protein n=1 Tax=Streptomyces sp. NPDC058733 TaxID=3346614 RepID=UPI00369B7744
MIEGIAVQDLTGMSALTKVLPPDLGADEEIDWSAAEARWEMLGGQEGLDIDPDHILAWGVTNGPDILCWLTTDPDPDNWPVLVCGRHTDEPFTLFPCGMVEFLRKLLLDEQAPLSIDVRGASPRYVHWLEQQKRWKAGLDPYSGEPRSTHP